jgi:hypothetical protein
MGRLARGHDPERGGYRFGGWQLEPRRTAAAEIGVVGL